MLLWQAPFEAGGAAGLRAAGLDEESLLQTLLAQDLGECFQEEWVVLMTLESVSRTWSLFSGQGEGRDDRYQGVLMILPHAMQCLHQMVLESQLPHAIVDLLFTITNSKQ